MGAGGGKFTRGLPVTNPNCLSSLFLLPFNNLKKLEKHFLATESGHEPRIFTRLMTRSETRIT